MPEPPVRFCLDEHVATAVAKGLRLRGIDCQTTMEAGLRTRPDQDHLAHASQEQRVLVTMDRGFLSGSKEHWGIAYCHQGSRTIGQILGALELIYEVYSAEDMRNRVEFI